MLFIVPGVGLLGRVAHFTEDMARLGYPFYFLSFLGVWKILGAVAILVPRFPRVKEWAYAGMTFDLTGAVVSRAVSGDAAFSVVIPLVVAIIVAASWALRPQGRVLAGPESPFAAQAAGQKASETIRKAIR